MNKKALAMAMITVIIWGSAFAAIRASLQGGYSSGHLVLFRYLIASLSFVIYALLPRVKFQLPTKKDWLRILILGWIGISTYHIGVTFGSQTVSAGTAAMLVASSPIFTTIIAMFVLKERLEVMGWIGLFIGFAGIAIITMGSNDTFTFSSGIILILIAAAATSIFFVLQKPLFDRYKPIELTAYFTWAGTLPFLVFSPGLIDGIQHATLQANLSAIYVGIFPAGIAYVTWAIALSMGNASSVSTILYIEPVFAILVAWFWLQEWPSTLSIVGGIITVSGVLLVNLLGKKKTVGMTINY
ncbi:threonine/homoserine efflux transporter RhtA [Neobacillus bataviensis]|uniref:Threonine/homoserine efflux transporter RhtA n=1 Tax=Neobacillus bataviensis TaxID=220685 RepID=A0A561D5F6_9BACI|nr:DMT family transporter [Neobacillus bataviensis]TWD98651.1 threonine/homoserine efflux transporter RhtA [Neobacillus bataviensis]